VIPAYNEESNVRMVLSTITSTLANYPRYQFRIILVNDGSTDNTSGEISAFIKDHSCNTTPISLINNEQNIGTARTMLKLFQLAVDHQPDLVIKLDMDHDFSHEEVLCKFFEKISTTEFYDQPTTLVGIRVIPNQKVMTFYEQARKVRTDNFLKQKLGLNNYDPVSGGTQLYPLVILKTVLGYPIVQNYKMKWGMDVLLPLLARKKKFQLITIPIYNSRYSFDRRSDLKVKSQYDAFTSVFELIEVE
jgi:glycosyltransferase involved in cell wall biosynthesis